MKYLLAIYEDERNWQTMSEADSKAVLDAYYRYTEALKGAGVYLAGDALQPVSTASTVRVRNGKTTVTDGPFAETKEQFGGYYLIEVPSLDEALKWAAEVPTSKTGSIEVRPLMDLPNP